MAIVFCPACNTKLSLGQQMAAAFVKCPKCGGRVSTASAGAATPAPAHAAATPPAMRAPERPRAAAPRPIPPPPPAEVDEGILEAEEAPRHRRKKKRRRYRAEEASSGKPVWFWALVGGLGLLTLCGAAVGVYFALQTDIVWDLATMGIVLAISVPANVVIFIAGVYIGNALGASIDLGEAHIAIAKSVLLLLVISVIDTIPIDYISLWLGLPVLIIGVVLLFQLDPWESRFLVAIYCCLKLVFTLVIVMAIESGAFSGGGGRGTQFDYDEWPDTIKQEEWDDEMDEVPPPKRGRGSKSEQPPGARAPRERAPVVDHQALLSAAYRRVRDLGGHESRDPGTNELTAIEFTDNKKMTDADLAHIGLLTTVRMLDLKGTSVTDKGLIHLKNMTELQTLNVVRTKVTEAGVRELKKHLPKVGVMLRE